MIACKRIIWSLVFINCCWQMKKSNSYTSCRVHHFDTRAAPSLTFSFPARHFALYFFQGCVAFTASTPTWTLYERTRWIGVRFKLKKWKGIHSISTIHNPQPTLVVSFRMSRVESSLWQQQKWTGWKPIFFLLWSKFGFYISFVSIVLIDRENTMKPNHNGYFFQCKYILFNFVS